LTRVGVLANNENYYYLQKISSNEIERFEKRLESVRGLHFLEGSFQNESTLTNLFRNNAASI